MTVDSRPSVAGDRTAGRHRSAESVDERPRRGKLLGVLLALVFAATGGGLLATTLGGGDPVVADTRTNPPVGTSSATDPTQQGSATADPAAAAVPADGGAGRCAIAGGTLVVSAAPEIADTLNRIVGSEPVGGCAVAVTAADPAGFVASWNSDPGHRPTVWIPDSSIWSARAGQAGVPTAATPPSIATSPIVLALSAGAAQSLQAAGQPLSLYSVLSSRLTGTPIRLGLPAPAESIEAIGALLEAQSAVAGQADSRAAYTWALRSSPADLPTRKAELLSGLTDDPNTAVPVSEQSIWAQDGAAGVVAVYSASAGTQLDYPFVVLGDDTGATAAATELLTLLTTADATQALLDNGFRSPAGQPGAVLAAVPGLDASRAGSSAAPTAAQAEQALRAVDLSNEPSRLLAVLDISGSMAQQVPGAGGATRLDLAQAAAIRGLGLYPPDSAIGLWLFSRKIHGDSDHREVVPVGPLSAVTDQKTGQQRMAEALAAVEVSPDGDTGLYDTTLDAVRQMRATWDPERVNTVLVLSDGQNDDPGSISLEDLTSTLRSEQDPARPVAVVAIAFGPDSDVSAMTQITAAAGGATYVAEDPREIGEIFLDSVGQRLCRPNC